MFSVFSLLILEELNESEGNKMSEEMFTMKISAQQIMRYFFSWLIHVLWELFLNVCLLLYWLFLFSRESATHRTFILIFPKWTCSFVWVYLIHPFISAFLMCSNTTLITYLLTTFSFIILRKCIYGCLWQREQWSSMLPPKEG